MLMIFFFAFLYRSDSDYPGCYLGQNVWGHSCWNFLSRSFFKY